jgi:hypothetical protein
MLTGTAPSEVALTNPRVPSATGADSVLLTVLDADGPADARIVGSFSGPVPAPVVGLGPSGSDLSDPATIVFAFPRRSAMS